MTELVSQDIKNLQNGVSQQTPALRYPSQCEEQENCRNDPVAGMGKRPNTVKVADMPDFYPIAETVLTHINRDANEKYIVTGAQGYVKVFDKFTGFSYPIETAPETSLYLSTGSIGGKALQALNTIDTTFILNRVRPVKQKWLEAEVAPGEHPERIQEIECTGHSQHLSSDWEQYALYNWVEQWTHRETYYEFFVAGTRHVIKNSTRVDGEVALILKELVEAAYPTVTAAQAGGALRVSIPDGDPTVIDVTGNSILRTVEGRKHDDTQGDTPDDHMSVARSDPESYGIIHHHAAAVTHPAVPLASPLIDPGTGEPLNVVSGALWYIKQADYATTYTCHIDTHSFSIITPEATSAQARAGLSTTDLADEMSTAINAEFGYASVRYGNVLHITSSVLASGEFTISSEDSLGNNASVAIKGYVEEFSLLPPVAPSDFRIEVRGSPETDVTAYHVVFKETTEDGRATAGHWEETHSIGVPLELDAATMPHALTRLFSPSYIAADNPLGVYFDFSPVDWGYRSVGDDNSAPFPSFCSEHDAEGLVTKNRYITAMTYHRNRLCFCSEENVIFSEAGKYRSFFPTTVVTDLPSDSIDIALSLNAIAPIRDMLDTESGLVLFAPKRQLLLRGGGSFTADTISIETVSTYDISPDVTPISKGSFIYFWMNDGSYSKLMEYAPRDTDTRWVAVSCNQHAPKYIEGEILSSAGGTVEDQFFFPVQTDPLQESSYIYVYNFLFKEGRKVQSAWQKWTFSGRVVHAYLDQGVLYLLVHYRDTDLRCLEKIELSKDTNLDGTVPVFLDRREEVASDFVLPNGDGRVLYSDGTTTWTGFRYNQQYTFSEFLLRDQEKKAVIGGRLQLRYLDLFYHNTTSFNVTVMRGDQVLRSMDFEGRKVGGGVMDVIGEVPVSTGCLRVPLHSKSSNTKITITNNTEHDALFHAAFWEGTYARRNRRV